MPHTPDSGISRIFVTGEVNNLADYRPTGINLNNRISSLFPEYHPKTVINIDAFYDAVSPVIDGWELDSATRSNLAHAMTEIERIETAFTTSGLNVKVDSRYLPVYKSNTRSIKNSKAPIGRLLSLYGSKKRDNACGMYFPTEKPLDSTTTIYATNFKWHGVAPTSYDKNAWDYARYMKNNAFAIINKDVPPVVAVHEWGHMAGLMHLKKTGAIKSYGAGFTGSYYGIASFSSIMNSPAESGITGKHTHQLIFSNPQTNCHLDLIYSLSVRPACGKAGESDARRALLETVLKWHRK